MSDVDEVPRPPAPEPPAVVQWLRRLRADPAVAVTVVVAIALAAGIALWRAGGDEAPVVAPTTIDQAVVAPSTTRPRTAVVHVVGAVRAPGVVELAVGGRVVDAIAAAGGAADDADTQRLNLAAPIVDGERIAVPRIGEPDPVPPPALTGGSEGATPPAGPLDLNRATQAQLEALPGIGPSLAAAILKEREKSGGFRRVEDLKKVRGIGDARFADLRELVTVSG